MTVFAILIDDERFDGLGLTEQEQCGAIKTMIEEGVYSVQDGFSKMIGIIPSPTLPSFGEDGRPIDVLPNDLQNLAVA